MPIEFDFGPLGVGFGTLRVNFRVGIPGSWARKKWICKKGALPIVFFIFWRPFFFFLISWAPRPLCAHRFFRFLVPINTFETPIKINEKLWAGRPLCAHRFFQIKPPINFFEKSWAHAHRAPMSFFISAHDPRIPTQLGPFSHLGPQLGLSSVEKKNYILFSIWAPHNEVWAPGASWAPAWALSTLKKNRAAHS